MIVYVDYPAFFICLDKGGVGAAEPITRDSTLFQIPTYSSSSKEYFQRK